MSTNSPRRILLASFTGTGELPSSTKGDSSLPALPYHLLFPGVGSGSPALLVLAPGAEVLAGFLAANSWKAVISYSTFLIASTIRCSLGSVVGVAVRCTLVPHRLVSSDHKLRTGKTQQLLTLVV